MFNRKDPKKYILAAGCSFTDANWASSDYPDHDCSFPRWPALLGDKLGVDNVVNLGKSGASNDFIINKVIDHILYEEKPWLVVIGLSEAIRFTPYNWITINPHILGREAVERRITFKLNDWSKSFTAMGDWAISRDENNDLGLMRAIFNNYITLLNRIVSLCDRLNIKIIICPLMRPLDIYDYRAYRAFHELPENHQWTESSVARRWMESEGFDDVNQKAIIGWPCLPEIGGSLVFGQDNDGSGFDRNSMTIGPLDGHPNALGHQHIAEKFYEHYKKTY